MAKTSMAIVMCTMCTISLCYNENEISTSDRENTTTLYPVNITVEDLKHQESNIHHDNIFSKSHNNKENNIHPQIHKEPNIAMDETRTEQSKDASEEIEKITDDKSDDDSISVDEEKESSDDNNSNIEPKGVKNEITTWSLETNYSQVNSEKETVKLTDEKEKKVVKDEQEKNVVKDFRPSPHLGSFFDEEAFVLTTQATITAWNPAFRKPTGFRSSPPDFQKLNYKKPIDAPYKFESNVFQHSSHTKHHTGLESKPTAAVPVKIPAGSMYKSPELYKDKPAIESDEEFGLKFKDEPKETSMKKSVNPWKSLLHVVTALLPVGLIVSALTPSIITLQSTDNNNPNFPNRFTRKVEGYRRLPQISEECKRRLLCEIHAHTYDHQSVSPGYKQCYKIECREPDAMMKVLRWMLRHRPRHTDHTS